ncbi:MAG: AmmeMemoRadiSam system protein B [Leptolinea sp.]|jgi:AmmeMemoRadiSam system protein B|nr:AmmeMemoRadiSam system protein B [Leptolinea sp.]
MTEQMDVRPSPIAGRWYESNPNRLARQIDAFLDEAVIPPLSGEVIGLVAPHAGHRYSGLTAAHAFKTVRGNAYDLVVVVAPFHDLYPGSLITTSHKAYATPLGVIEVNQPALAVLDSEIEHLTDTTVRRISHDSEHSLEIELPFLQRSLAGAFTLLPVMVRSRNARDMRALGEALAKVAATQSTLLVASSDLSHFYSESQAEILDAFLEKQILELSPEGVLDADISGKGFACGAGAISAVLWASLTLNADKAVLLRHSTSADETGDRRSVVGYGAVAILKS